MLWRMAGLCVLLVMSAAIVTGCSRDEPQKPAAAPLASAPAPREPLPDGEALFKQYCAPWPPEGGHVRDSGAHLHGSVFKGKHITTPEDIVRIMRNPLSRMIRFDPSTLSDKDARAIAEYVLKTFK